MRKKSLEAAANQVPNHVSDAISEYLSSFDPMTRKPDEVLKGNRLPSHFDISSPAYARSNRQAAKDAVQAARLHSLQSPRFEAVRGKWSDKLQMVLLIPESKFDMDDPELYEVSWAADGSEMRIDLAEALVPRQWSTETGWIRRVKATLQKNLPVYGSALVLDLPGGELREDPQVVRERKERKAAKEAAQGAGQGAGQGAAQGNGQGTAQGAAQGSGQGIAQGAGQGTAQGAPQGAGQGTTQGAAHGPAQGTAHGPGQGSSNTSA